LWQPNPSTVAPEWRKNFNGIPKPNSLAGLSTTRGIVSEGVASHRIFLGPITPRQQEFSSTLRFISHAVPAHFPVQEPVTTFQDGIVPKAPGWLPGQGL